MVVVPRWCGVYGRYSMHICGTFMNALDLVVSYECMYAGESSTNFICECTLFFLRTRWSETSRELTMIKEANIWNALSYVCKNRYRVISNSEICTWIQIRTDLVSFQFQPKYFARHFNAEQKLWPLTICRLNHYIHVCFFYKKQVHWRTMGVDIIIGKVEGDVRFCRK